MYALSVFFFLGGGEGGDGKSDAKAISGCIGKKNNAVTTEFGKKDYTKTEKIKR
jgi:hypothetical protein